MICKNFINQAVFLGNTARPISRPVAFEWFGFTSSVKRISGYFGNKRIDFIKDFFIFSCPPQIVSKSGFFKANHLEARSSAYCTASSRLSKDTRFFPCSIFSTAFVSCIRLAGDRNKYSVSSRETAASRTVISISRSRNKF